MRPDLATITNVFVDVYDKNSLLVQTIDYLDLYKFFAYAMAFDSNDEMYLIMRQTAPLSIDCYRLVFRIGDGGTEIRTYYSDMVCGVEKYTVKKYSIDTSVLNTEEIEVTYSCDGGMGQTVTYNILQLGFWFDYLGPDVVMYIPENCTITSVTLAAAPITFSVETVELGPEICYGFVQITGSGIFDYDCKGRYYTEDIDITPEAPYVAYNFNPELVTGYIENYPITLLCSRVKELANKITPQRIAGTCYIPRTEYMTQYRLDSNAFHVPAWFVEEVNIVSATQMVTLSGIADDNNVLYPLVQADEYNWREVQGNSQFFIPQLVFETCICFTDFKC